MSTKCYSMVRGASMRVTGLKPCGTIPDIISYAVSKSVVKVTIREQTVSGTNELLRTPDDQPRIRLIKPDRTARFLVDIDFIRVDPGLFALIAGAPGEPEPLHGLAYGEDGPFYGEGAVYGGHTLPADTVGFDANTRVPPQAFGLEVWSNIANSSNADCLDRQYGYTLFPYLKGGVLSGFTVSDKGMVSFSLKGAHTRRAVKWGYGPYDLTGVGERLVTPVSGNIGWRSFLTTATPPEQTDGVVSFMDVVDNQYAAASSQTSDIVDGQFVVTSTDSIEGGYAA